MKIPYSIINKHESSKVFKSPLANALAVDLTESVYYSPQYFIQQKSLSLIQTIFTEVDFAIDNPFMFLVNNETFSTLATRYGVSKNSHKQVTLPIEEYDVFLGYVKISSNTESRGEEHKAFLNLAESTGTVAEDCFTWVPVKNGLIEDALSEVSSYLITFKYVFNTDKVVEYLQDLEKDLDEFLGYTTKIVAVIHEPSITGIHLEEPLRILSPTPTMKRKVLENVVFTVGRTTIAQSDKAFEIEFRDKVTDVLLYSERSVDGLGNFVLTDTLQSISTSYRLPINKYSTSTSSHFPKDPFKVTYNIPKNIQKILASNLNYKINVLATDSTSKRL